MQTGLHRFYLVVCCCSEKSEQLSDHNLLVHQVMVTVTTELWSRSRGCPGGL